MSAPTPILITKMLTIDSYIFFDIVHQVLESAVINQNQMGIGLTKNPHASVQLADKWLEFQLIGREIAVTFGDGSKVFDLADPNSIQQITDLVKDIKARY